VPNSTTTVELTAPSANGHHQPLDIDKIGAQLLDALSERTGYPQEMLDLDLDLEADLGIDSIKRVEILGGLTESLNGDGANLQSKLDLEKLTSRRSLRGILAYLSEALLADGESSEAAAGNQTAAPRLENIGGEASNTAPSIQRGLVQLTEIPLSPGAVPRVPKGAVILTDDGRGVARDLANRLADFGQPIAIVSLAEPEAVNGDGYRVDLTDPAAVAEFVQRVRTEFGAIGGLVHALPLAAIQEPSNLVDRARRDVKSLYLLARELEPDLRQAEGGNAFLLAATALGGELGYGNRELDSPALAAHGAVLGFLKCVGLEWPEVLVRAVDVDPSDSAAALAECLLRELTDRRGPLEVGYRQAARVTWEPVAAPLQSDDETAKVALASDSAVLITGGARGITAEIACALAERYQPNLIIVGRSPRPEVDEAPDTASLTEPTAIKQAIMARLATEGRKASPAEVEAEFRALLRDREIRGNLSRLTETGAHVEYHSLDVRDREALARLITDVTARFGNIAGVVHGAGVIEDKLLRDKTPESFDRVFGTKVQSAQALAELLDPEELKFCVFFASIASRYGNRGQSDYAAANEVLSKLAMELDRRWPARVFSIAWGPWKQVGMVAELEPHLEARGVALIHPAVGAAKFIEELEFGWKGESEVLIAGGADRVTKPPVRAAEPVSV
jgi:NAD(P)-dependent dehydrogenase (short-subunit alcohol dehydrogenase family)